MKKHIALLAASLLAASSASAAITIDTVLVGNTGNANDSSTGNLYGGVPPGRDRGKTEMKLA